MQELRLLLISLATVLLSSILLFIYFKSRIVQVEEKLEIMFNLIQSHAQEKQMMSEQFVPNQMFDTPFNEENKQRINLIDVSDDENNGSETDESDTDSDSDDDTNNLVIDNDSLSENNIKKIALKLDNSDVLFGQNIGGENINHLENVHEDIIVQKEENDENDENDEKENDEKENDEKENDEKENDGEENDEGENSGECGEEENFEEVNLEEGDEEENIVQELSLDLSKLKVAELRKMCSDKGKSGYKSLRKNELIELLEN